MAPWCFVSPPLGDGDGLGDSCWPVLEKQRLTLSKWWWTWWCRWLCTKEKGTAKGVFSFVIITWYCPFNSWGNSTSRCTASDSYWFEWLSRARLIGPRDWNSDSAARGELTRQSLSAGGLALQQFLPAHDSRELSRPGLTATLTIWEQGRTQLTHEAVVRPSFPGPNSTILYHPLLSLKLLKLMMNTPVLYHPLKNLTHGQAPCPSCTTCPQGALQH